MFKFTIACAAGVALSFLGTFAFAQETPPVHQGDWPIHNWHKHQPTQDELKDLDLQDVTRQEAREVDRLYNQLESTGGHPELTGNEPQGGDELDETGLAKEIGQENRLLDKELNICRGC